jgi:hypothetical protein
VGRLARGEPRRFEGGSFVPNNSVKRQTVINAPVIIQLPVPGSQEQGIGKSPGMRWPWTRSFSSRAPSAYRRYTWPNRRTVPAGRYENRNPLYPWQRTYLQGNRHTWPGGGVIEYPASQSLTRAVLRIRQQREPEHR